MVYVDYDIKAISSNVLDTRRFNEILKLGIPSKEIFDTNLIHNGKNIREVMNDIVTQYPERTFCFLNENHLREKVRFFHDYFLPGYTNKAIAYAVKANPKNRILNILSESNISTFDCASPNEIKNIRDINKQATILYNNPIRLKRQIREAAKLNVTHYTAHDKRGVEKVIQNFSSEYSNKPLELVVRMETSNKKAVINLSSKFGAHPSEVNEILHFIDKETSAKSGIAIHTGSQNKDPKMFYDAIMIIKDMIQINKNVKIINLGGGFPVSYFDDDRFHLAKYFEVINKALKNLLKRNDIKILIEPGRSIIAEAVDLLIPVIEVSIRNGKKCAYIDDGIFTSFSDSTIHGWKYNFLTFSNKNKKFSDKKEDFTIFGRSCDSGDVIKKVSLPANIDEGDYLWIRNAGAYMDSQSTRFNGFEPPKYVSYNL